MPQIKGEEDSEAVHAEVVALEEVDLHSKTIQEMTVTDLIIHQGVAEMTLMYNKDATIKIIKWGHQIIIKKVTISMNAHLPCVDKEVTLQETVVQ